MNEIEFKKRIRLKGFPYKGCYRYFITISTFDKSPFFTNKATVDFCLEYLKSISRDFNFNIWGYCFMPDHLHLLIEGTEHDSDMKKFISMFKQKTAYNFKKQYNVKLWQHNYYESILRKKDSLENILKYIFKNPVRKGLVEHYTDYTFNGSFELDITTMICPRP